MSLEEGKTYADKHASDTQIDSNIRDQINAHKKDDTLPCAVAFEIANQLNVTPQQVGTTIDLMNLKLVKCQIGLFGYDGGKKLTPDHSPDPALKEAILSASVDNRMPCTKAWEIAEQSNIGKLTLGNVCEGLGIRIKPCQLGAF